jgi:Arc/MetJ-type ribon-helix-helix transcriptional regulator
MKTLTVRLPEPLAAEIESDARRRKISKSDVVRERLQSDPKKNTGWPASLDAIGDLIGSIKDLPADISARKKEYLRATSYGKKRPR